MEKLQAIDSHASFRHVERRVESAVKSGELTREKAHKVLNGARESYRNENYNRVAERFNKGQRKF